MTAPDGPRIAQIVTNETCNQNCAFCDARRPHESRDVAAFERVKERIEAAVARGAHELVLTGGEPTLRRDLPVIVRLAKRAGAARVVLETNGSLLSAPRVRALAAEGLDAARVHLPGWGARADALTCDEGGFDRTFAALRALADAHVPIEIAAPVVRSTLASVVALPDALAEARVPVTALVLGVPTAAPDPAELAALDEAADAVEAVDARARRVGVPVRLDAGRTIPPCLFREPHRVAHLFSMTRGGAQDPRFVHVDACNACAARANCGGVPRAAVARGEALRLRPIRDDRTRRRLTTITSVADQIERELVTRDVRRLSDGSTVSEHIVRVHFHCNQACRFCFVSTHLPAPEVAAVEAAIAEIARARGVLTLSGGEPTLNPRLVEYVRLGKALGAREIEVQTNAIRFGDDPTLAQRLADAGVDVAFVSLHGATAAISDRITAAPGTFVKTVAGIDALATTSITLRLNFVFCAVNLSEFPAYVALVADRWPKASISVSFVAPSTDVVPVDADTVPRLSEVLPALREGMRIAAQRGIAVHGFESMCGIPLCLVPGELATFFDLADAPPDRGEFVKAEACAGCALERRCFGLRRNYVALYGTTELRPVASGAPC